MPKVQLQGAERLFRLHRTYEYKVSQVQAHFCDKSCVFQDSKEVFLRIPEKIQLDID